MKVGEIVSLIILVGLKNKLVIERYFQYMIKSLKILNIRGLVWTLCLCGILLAFPINMMAQDGKVRIELIHADHGVGSKGLGPDVTVFKGNVHIRHKGMNMYCDSILLYGGASNSIEAFSNVKMEQGDTLHMYGDYLFYDGATELARLRNNVKLINREVQLVTDSLNFDRKDDLGYYFKGGELTDPTNKLVSDWGQYNVNTKLAKFFRDVNLVNDKATMTSDTLNYDTESKVISILGPSEILSNSTKINSSKGFYNSLTQEVNLYDRSTIDTDGRIMTGDSLYYDHLKGFGRGFGNVQMVDSARKNMMEGNYCFYDEFKQNALLYDRAMLVDFSKNDSLFIHGDTVRLNTFEQNTDSVYNLVRLYNKVRMYKSDMQGVCDSLVYNSKDSCITLYTEPVLWNFSQQLLGEKIMLYLNDSTIDWAHIENQALAVEKLDTIHYNQVVGKQMKAYFDNGEMRKVEVDGNVIINYYQEERNGYLLGLTYAETSLMEMELYQMQLEKIRMTTATSGVFYPLPLIPSDKLFLDNFVWLDYLRPKSKEDIFLWRAKKSEHMLRESSPEVNMPMPAVQQKNRRKK